MPLPYPPPFMDIATLAVHICCGESTIEKWVREGTFPLPKMQGGKRLWRWREVEKHLAREATAGTGLPDRLESIREATRAAASKTH